MGNGQKPEIIIGQHRTILVRCVAYIPIIAYFSLKEKYFLKFFLAAYSYRHFAQNLSSTLYLFRVLLGWIWYWATPHKDRLTALLHICPPHIFRHIDQKLLDLRQ
jgi:hypothetical protein